MTINPRYLAYCRACGISGDVPAHEAQAMQMEKDEMRSPGGVMIPFMLWSNEMLRRFEKVSPGSFLYLIGDNGRPVYTQGTLIDQIAFTEWLDIHCMDPSAMELAEKIMQSQST